MRRQEHVKNFGMEGFPLQGRGNIITTSKQKMLKIALHAMEDTPGVFLQYELDTCRTVYNIYCLIDQYQYRGMTGNPPCLLVKVKVSLFLP